MADQHVDVLTVFEQRLGWTLEVALAIRRMLEELSVA